MKPFRLLILTPSHCISGGTERILANLAEGLPRRGFHVVFGLAKGARFNDPERFLAAFPRVETISLDGRTGTREGRLRAIRRALSTVRPDGVIVCRIFDGLEVLSAAKRAGWTTRLVTTVFANEPEYVFDLSLYAPFIDLCVTDGRLASAVVTQLTSLPTVVIPGPISPPSVNRAEQAAEAPLRLGYVGRLDEPQKRVLDLPAVLARLREMEVPFSCRIAGSGPAEDDLRQALRRLSLDERIHFEGLIDNGALYERIYPHLDVLLHLAAWEGNPIVPREAMAHGVVPVVSRFRGSAAEGLFVHERNCLTFDVGDIEGAAAAVAKLHRDRGLLRQLSQEAARGYSSGHSPDVISDAWSKALRSLMLAPPRLGDLVPEMPRVRNRLDRIGLPARAAETLRRLLGRRFPAREAGAEWPHWSGIASTHELDAIRQLGTTLDIQARHGSDR